MQDRYDLHTHSVVSDGTETPAMVADFAARAGLRGFALTDHDSTEGWEEAARRALQLGLDFIGGIELSSVSAGASVHVLGYCVDPLHPALFDLMASIREHRIERAWRMVDALPSHFAVDFERVLATVPPGGAIGRPHIADALVASGHFPDRSAVFAELLTEGGPHYEPYRAPDVTVAVQLIASAGGVPVLAHPAADTRASRIDSRLPELIDAGLVGLELDHRENSPERTVSLRRIAQKRGLLVTGGSDFHGDGKPNLLGENSTSAAVVEAIRGLSTVKRDQPRAQSLSLTPPQEEA